MILATFKIYMCVGAAVELLLGTRHPNHSAGCLASHPASCHCTWDGNPKCLGLATQVGGLDGVPSFWL